MALTEIAVRTARAASVDRKLADEKGLYLLVTVSGSKLWRLKYRIDGKEKRLALGSYPEVELKEARNQRDSARRAAETGSDPAAAKREARIARQFSASNTFGAIAEEYAPFNQLGKSLATFKAGFTDVVTANAWLLPRLRQVSNDPDDVAAAGALLTAMTLEPLNPLRLDVPGRKSTWTGRKKGGRHASQRLPATSAPPGTRQWTWG